MDGYEYTRQNAKNIAAAFVLYSDMRKTDLRRHALVHFQINISYKYTATPHENCKKFRKPYLKMMSSTIDSLKISVSSKKPKSAHIDIMGKVGKSRENHLC